MKRAVSIVAVIVLAGAMLFVLGPKAPVPNLNPTPVVCDIPLHDLDRYLDQRESRFKTLKPENEAAIVWKDDSVQRTEYAIVFLHGFSASKVEGRPVTTRFAKEFGMNLLEPRLFGHGLDTTDALGDITPENYLNSAREAVAMAKVIGEKVVIMASSTGATLGLYLAAHDPDIAALFCYSPNIDIFDPRSSMLTGPWGLQLARSISGGKTRGYAASEEFKRYWQTEYRLEALVMLRALLDASMTPETFSKVTQPVFTGCYFKSDSAQDSVVSVVAMRAMMAQLGTAEAEKRMVEFPDAGAHVITNPLRSRDVEGVYAESRQFAVDVLGL